MNTVKTSVNLEVPDYTDSVVESVVIHNANRLAEAKANEFAEIEADNVVALITAYIKAILAPLLGDPDIMKFLINHCGYDLLYYGKCGHGATDNKVCVRCYYGSVQNRYQIEFVVFDPSKNEWSFCITHNDSYIKRIANITSLWPETKSRLNYIVRLCLDQYASDVKRKEAEENLNVLKNFQV